MLLLWGLVIVFALVVILLVVQGIQSSRQYPAIKEKILAALTATKEMSGRELQSVLRSQGYKLSSPRFYHIMAQLEKELYVDGWYRHNTIDGEQTRARWYCLRN
jgi:hypothetical protein